MTAQQTPEQRETLLWCVLVAECAARGVPVAAVARVDRDQRLDNSRHWQSEAGA